MAQKSQSRPGSPIKAIEAALVMSVLVAGSAKAEEGGIASQTAVHLLDRTQLPSAVSLERTGTSAQRRGISLILAVQVNGMDHGLAQFQMMDDRLWASQQVLRDLGFRISREDPLENLISLDRFLGGTITYNASMQTVSLMIESTKLAVGTSVLNSIDQSNPVASSATGALINYDVYANVAGGSIRLNGFTETRLFSGNFLLENTALFRADNSGLGWRSEAIRLDTSAAISFPQSRLTARAGDIITRSVSWSRATRIGGLRIGTDFALQPYLVTAPIPSFFGEATLPSSIDLYINDVKRYSGEVTPGPFELGSGANRINGAGHAHIVVTDILGQVTTLNFPIYDAPALLRKGLSDWSLEVGAVRKKYGISSFNYAPDLAASASWRTGLSDRLTLETHGEIGKALWNAGAGLAWKLPIGGVASASLAASRSRSKTGQRIELGYSWTDSRFNLSASVQRASKHYADIASHHGAPIPIARDLLNIGVNSGKYGNFGFSVIRQRYSGEASHSFASLNWTKALSDRFSISASARHIFEGVPNSSVFLTLTFNPKKREHLSANIQANKHRTNVALSYRKSLPYAGGTGWALTANHDGQRFQAAAQIDHLGSFGQITAGSRINAGNLSGYAGYSGALVMMDKKLFLSRKIYDGFAVVSTGGVADLPVKLHNREVGRTNANGHLLVAGLNSYQTNNLSIDPTNLNPELTIGAIDQQAVPSQRSGVLVNFDITPTRSVLMTLVDESGKRLPLGVKALMHGWNKNLLMTGFDGQLFIEEAIAGAAVSLETEDGPCQFQLPQELPAHKAGRLGTMICEKP